MPFKIDSLQNPLVKHMVKLREERAYRYEQRRVFVEGRNLIKELKKPLRLFVLDEEPIPCDEVYRVSPAVMKKMSGVVNPEGLIAEMAMPQNCLLTDKRHLLVLDGVSDPGNLGTLLRTALALGWEGVAIIEGSCDPYNEKALRAAKGATFRIPLFQGSWQQLPKLPRYTADIHGIPLDQVKTTDGMMLILSSESRGVSPEGREGAQAITIPMTKEMESLNVAIAGGILMYALRGKK